MVDEIERVLADDGVSLHNWSAEKARTRWVVRRGEEPIWRFITKREAVSFLDAVKAAYLMLFRYPELLANYKHPKLPGSNLTARDYVIWLLDNAQYLGVRRALDIFDAVVKAPPQPEPVTYTDNVISFPTARRA
jgi:hypothetical protein